MAVSGVPRADTYQAGWKTDTLCWFLHICCLTVLSRAAGDDGRGGAAAASDMSDEGKTDAKDGERPAVYHELIRTRLADRLIDTLSDRSVC